MNLDQIRTNSAPAVKLLKAMANERRLYILCHLHDGELSVGELARLVDLSQSALSQHLAWLRRDGLVKTRKEAQTVYYSLASIEVGQMISLLHSMYCEQPVEAAAA
ncbi:MULTISPECIES: ArsR/SmtB family transcription factor [Corallincola]|uniref:Transcriptional regulator n=3 Tax=Corallincola TaxID=1775176 RepID=A0A368N6T6_9GAMM|nr:MULTISPECIES: metalloregulator ArsR/SmtB family transcription factor [Corallincola]RCU45743.1 transcriptional regulator [Corallincola holothuriorum]TAA41859.1 transcriptional regulator [Corallincola spongiicola]TCI02143.1 transcriptional regulator [Corallincola luteus]